MKKGELKSEGYPVINSGRTLYGYYDKYNNEGPAFTVAARGEYAAFVNYFDKRFWAGGLCYPYKSKDESKTLTKFIYYSLKNIQQRIRDGIVAEGSIPALNKSDFENIKLLVPPLEVQREIVRILDNFTELTENLTENLTAELTARKKQYEYYRDTLLTFNDNNPLHSLISRYSPNGVEYKKIGDICNISVGGDVPKNSMSKQKTEKYSVPIISNGIGENALYGYTDVPKVKEPGVTVAARGTIGYAEYRDYPFYPIIRLLTAVPKDATAVNTKYLYYCLQGKQYSSPTGGIPQLTAPELEKVSIPVPPLEVQRQIVQILDRFDALCNDLIQGLPAEIEARRKQYEYYRDQLLTFKRA